MAKRKEIRGKIEKEIDSINASVNSILNQYPQIKNSDKKKILSKLNRQSKKALKKWEKSNSGIDYYDFLAIETKKSKVENSGDKIPIKYGITEHLLSRKRLESIKNKEQYLDGLFSKKMKTILNKYEAPNDINEARILEGLIAQYSKKIKSTKFYDPYIVENSINKLTNFRSKLNAYDYDEYISIKKDIIYDEINDYDNGREIRDYYEEMTGEPEEIYKSIEQVVLMDGYLIGLNFNFF